MHALLVAVLILLSSALTPSAALAVCPDPPAESPLAPGEVGLFFDAAGTIRCMDAVEGSPFLLHLVARAPEGGIGSYSIPWLSATRLPPGLPFMTSTTMLPDGSAFDLAPTADWCDFALPSQAGCAVEAGELVVLGVMSITPDAPLAGTAQFETQCPTFAGNRPEPVWYEPCGSTESRSLQGGDRLAVGFGEAPVAAAHHTWTTVKTRYRGP